jgi:hypothetical protein
VSWTFVYLMVGLKIPIAALLYLVWWAIHQVPETAEGGAGNGGMRKPRHPRPPLPRRPRPRGACGLPAPQPPQRMRVVAGRSLATARARRHTVARPAR